MYLFRRITYEKNLTKRSRARVDLYQSLNADLNYLIGCAKSNVHPIDNDYPNWKVIEKNPNQAYHPGCVFQAEGMTTFRSGCYADDGDFYECRAKVYIFNTDYLPKNMIEECDKYNISFMKDPDQVYAETN